MSDQLQVAAALRRMDDLALVKLVNARAINTTHLRDFFDFADAVIAPKSATAAIASLSNRQIDTLLAVINNTKPDTKIAGELIDLALVEKTKTGLSVFEYASNAYYELDKTKPAQLLSLTSDDVELRLEEVDRDAHLAIFDIIQALTELIFDLEQRYIREVGKRGVGLPDIKRLANHLRKPNDYAKQVFEIALWADLAVVSHSRWQLGAQYDNWLTWSDGQRWSHLANVWLDLIGEAGARELSALRAGHSFAESLQASYRFADLAVNSRINRITDLADKIGLVANNLATTWFAPAVAGQVTAAEKLVVSGLPAQASRLIIQADLTLIAPSPLPTELEIRLRRIADTEQIGMASSYRLSALSVSHGLETGMTASEIRSLLLELSERELPQPVDYLLREAEQRFGRLRISDAKNSGHTVVTSEDSILLAEIQNNQKLKPLALHFSEKGDLHTRFETDLVYFTLRDAGYVAVRVDDKNKVISPTAISERDSITATSKSVANDIQRLRDQDAKLGSEPDDDDLLRQIQLAIKNKANALVTLQSANGELVEYLIQPVGLANGRLRAKDRKADVERTLPLASITSIVLQ
ncbi:MAG: helicase-associated domain-containing protein [Micrococcales bacterium]